MVFSGEVTPERLAYEPSLILHQCNFDPPLASSDGRVGAVTPDGYNIITTPNSNIIFEPPLGGDRSLFLRSNLRFGDDDPLQWPQMYLHHRPYLPCILSRPPVEDALIVMWRLPDREDFVAVEGGVLEGVGRVGRAFFDELRRFSLDLLARAKHQKYKEHRLISELIPTLEHLLHRLEFIATNFRTMQLGVRETQRVYLELRAVLDYTEIYHPLLKGSDLGGFSHPRITANTVGAFTNDLAVCDEFFRAGIPVWLIRPFSELHSIRVRKLVPLLLADGLIPITPATRPSHCTIYRGSGDNVAKYYALARHVTGFLRYPNPFGSVRAKELVKPPPSQTKREERRERYTPYSNRPKPKPGSSKTDRNKFEDPTSPFLPPSIPSWKSALSSFDINDSVFVTQDVTPTDLGYVFPEPGMFLACESEWRCTTYFKTWLKYRTALIYRVSSHDSNATPMPNAVWRNFLMQDLMRDKANTSSQESRGGKLRALAADFLRNCLDAEEVHFKAPNCDTMQWNGKVVENLSNEEREEIVWELAELNFRFELLALDSRATTALSENRHKSVLECFPGSSAKSLLVADLGAANCGLSSQDWEERALYLHALRRLMATWQGKVPQIIKTEKVKWTIRDIEDLEAEITKFYVASFYNHFRRAPVVPRGLSHETALYTPPAPQFTVVDPRPNVFYDLSLVDLERTL